MHSLKRPDSLKNTADGLTTILISKSIEKDVKDRVKNPGGIGYEDSPNTANIY